MTAGTPLDLTHEGRAPSASVVPASYVPATGSEGRRARSGLLGGAVDQGEQAGDLVVGFGGVPEMGAGGDRVAVAAPVAGAGEVSGLFQVRDDGLDGAFGDPAGGRDVAQPDARGDRPVLLRAPA